MTSTSTLAIRTRKRSSAPRRINTRTTDRCPPSPDRSRISRGFRRAVRSIRDAPSRSPCARTIPGPSLRPRREPPRATKPHATSARRWRASHDRSTRRSARRDETLPPDPTPPRGGPAEVEGRDPRGRTRVRCDRARRDRGLDRRVGFWQDDPRLALRPPPRADVGYRATRWSGHQPPRRLCTPRDPATGPDRLPRPGWFPRPASARVADRRRAASGTGTPRPFRGAGPRGRALAHGRAPRGVVGSISARILGRRPAAPLARTRPERPAETRHPGRTDECVGRRGAGPDPESPRRVATRARTFVPPDHPQRGRGAVRRRPRRGDVPREDRGTRRGARRPRAAVASVHESAPRGRAGSGTGSPQDPVSRHGRGSEPRAPAAGLSPRGPMPVRHRSMPERGTAAPDSGGDGEALGGVPPGGGTGGRAACRPARGGTGVWIRSRGRGYVRRDRIAQQSCRGLETSGRGSVRAHRVLDDDEREGSSHRG